MSILFALTLFLAAALSFVVQPLVARQLLPLAGGAPAVWTTCLVFFQLMLLAGYFYAHWLSAKSFRFAVLFHTCLVAGAAVTLLNDASFTTTFLAPDSALGDQLESTPVLALVLGLLRTVGLPYFALATTAPLLQAWFARSQRDPYWLYAASNAGSLLGLLAYPFLVEPFMTLAEQRWDWRQGFNIVFWLIVLSGCAAAHMARQPKPVDAQADSERPSAASRLKWIALSALTASLLASVTAHLSTDIAPMPLLWVVPLALYLLTYIITFARWPERARLTVGRLAPMAICFSTIALLSHATEPMAVVATIHLAGLTLVCLLCHGELAASKPVPQRLTDFYLCLALGGVLGGSVNAIVAPLLFAHLGPIEYPIALVLAALVRPNRSLRPVRVFDFAAPLMLGAFTYALSIVVPRILAAPSSDDVANQMIDRVLRGGLLFGVPVAIGFALVWRPLRFALCLAAVLAVGMLTQSRSNHTLLVERNFFGTLTVSQAGDFVVLTNGTTRHGMQKLGEDPPSPMMYYHRAGPLGRVFAKPAQTVGVVGLGCGAMAAYAQPGQNWTFFEIDPGVVRIAADERYFSFLKHCQAKYQIVLGDARRKLAEVPDGTFDLLAIDAFSSDAVPVHLLTREALELYLRKLKPDGRLLLHLSNRYLDLPSLVGRGLERLVPVVLAEHDTASDQDSGKWASIWVIAAKNKQDLGRLPFFTPVRPHPGPIWTDDYAPLSGVWKRDDD